MTLWTAAHQASLSITNSQSLLKLMSIKLVMPSSVVCFSCLHLILCHPLLLPSIFPSIRVVSSESVLHTRCFSFSISPSNEYSGLISFRIGFISLQRSFDLFHQLSSVVELCPTLCDPMDCSMSGLLVHHQLLELAQTHVHRVSDAIQPSHPLWSPSPPAFNLSQYQGHFQ